MPLTLQEQQELARLQAELNPPAIVAQAETTPSQKFIDFNRKVYGLGVDTSMSAPIKEFAINNPLMSPGKFLESTDFSKINPAYATNANYAKGISQGEDLISTLKVGTPEYDIAQKVIATARQQGQNPRLLLASVLHETAGFKQYPQNNPGGVKPSAAINQFIKNNPDTRNVLTQLKSTREQLFDSKNPLTINKLKEMFSDPRIKFETNYPTDKKGNVQGDIINLKDSLLNKLNAQLKTAQENNTNTEWKKLFTQLKTIQQLNPKKANFWISQPFMRYDTKEAGLVDMIRAQKGGRDTSSLVKNEDGTIERFMPNGTKITYGKK